MTRFLLVVLLALLVTASGCHDIGEDPRQPISTDAQLFALVTRTEPFRAFAVFPLADSLTRGTLNGSHAHQPLVRVSMNAKALSVLRNGRLPDSTTFPDGSIIFKEIQTNSDSTALYAIMYKDRTNAFAEPTSGWLWSEYEPNGRVVFSISTRGSGCIGCHSRERGPRNDFVRTFERQRP